MTPDEVEAIRERVEAATPGPWWSDESDSCWRLHGVHAVLPGDGIIPDQIINHQILKAPKRGTPYAEYWPNAADAEFIAHARTDVPALLAALAEAQRREELMRPVVEEARAFRHQEPGRMTGSHGLFAAVDTYETQTGGTDG